MTSLSFYVLLAVSVTALIGCALVVIARISRMPRRSEEEIVHLDGEGGEPDSPGFRSCWDEMHEALDAMNKGLEKIAQAGSVLKENGETMKRNAASLRESNAKLVDMNTQQAEDVVKLERAARIMKRTERTTAELAGQAAELAAQTSIRKAPAPARKPAPESAHESRRTTWDAHDETERRLASGVLRPEDLN